MKWSFDRAVTVGGFPTFQMAAGSLQKPEQFVVVDDHTFRVDFIRADKLTMPDIGVPVPVIMNSELCKKNATAADPWAMEWCKNNHASGGAYKVERWQPGQEVVYVRNDDWKNGPMPKVKRVIMRIIPSAGNRRALLERGDADLSFDLPSKDFSELKIVAQAHRDRHADRERDDVSRHERQPEAVRQRQGAPGRGLCRALSADHGLGDVRPGDPAVRRRRQQVQGRLLAAEGRLQDRHRQGQGADGRGGLSARASRPRCRSTSGLASTNEPLTILVQESLAQIGIKTTINKIPGANWRGELLKKNMPMITNAFGGWLNYPEYFFFWCYHGQNAVFNTMGYKNPAMDALIDKARFTTGPEYEAAVKGFIDMAFEEVPRVPIFQPLLNVAMQKNVTGYRYWFHRQLDYRQLAKG